MGVLAETAIAVLGLFTGGLRQPPNLDEMLLIMTGKKTKGAKGRRGNVTNYTAFNNVDYFPDPKNVQARGHFENEEVRRYGLFLTALHER